MSARKGLSTALVIVVTIVVLLVVALVILSLFGGTTARLGDLTKFRNQCVLEFSTSCTATGNPPPTWSLPREIVEGGETISKTCAAEFSTARCENRQSTGLA